MAFSHPSSSRNNTGGNSIPVVDDKLISPLRTSIRKMILLVEQPIMNMLTLLCFVTSKQPKNKGYPQNPIKSVATTNTTHQEYTAPGAPTYPYFFQTVESMYISALSVPFWPCLYQKSTTSLSDLQHCLIWTWNISKLPGENGYAYHPERILDDIFQLFTVSPPWPQIINLKYFDQKDNFDRQVYPS